MAASMRTCCLSVPHMFLRSFSRRNYARRLRRGIQGVLTPEQELQQFKRPSRVTDPQKNPFISYVPDDPVQQNLSEVKKQRTTRNTNLDMVYDARSGTSKSAFNVSNWSKNQGSTMNHSEKMPRKDMKPSNLSKVQTFSKRTPEKRNEKKEIKPDASRAAGKGKQEQKGITYTKLMDKDADWSRSFANRVLYASSKKHREECSEIILEGRRLIIDAIEAGAKLKVLYFSGADTLDGIEEILEGQKPEVFKVAYKQMKQWSNVVTPQGLVGIFEMPAEGEAPHPASNTLPLTLVCDQIRDAGNMGTLLRSAAAVGCQQVIAVKGCVDLWDPKVLRAGTGAHFRVPVRSGVSWSGLQSYLPSEFSVCVADCRQPTDVVTELQTSSPTVEEIDTLDQMSSALVVDRPGEADDGKDDEPQSVYDNEELLQLYVSAPIKVSGYNTVDFTKNHTVLVIGGETTGISLAARKLAYDTYGQCVTLPMFADIQSLNSAVAGSVLMYEILRQCTTK